MGMLISGIAASEHVDSSGEILKVEGCDISTLAKDGNLNFEHNNDDADDVVGKILFAKKIFNDKDCDTDDQLKFWSKVKVPYVYIIGELFDAQEHPGAIAIASMMKYSKSKNEPMMIGFSIEGSTLERDGMNLTRTVARRCATTLKPCNKSAIADILESIPDAKKAMGSDGFKPLSKGMEDSFSIFDGTIPNATSKAISDLLDFSIMTKSLDAGMATGAPGTNTQGAVLQKEPIIDRELKHKILEKIRDKWDRITPIQDFLKADMPELGKRFKDHFSELMDELELKKSDIVSYRNTISHIPHTKEQKYLIAGIPSNNQVNSDPTKKMNSKGQRVIVRRGFNDENDKVFSSEKATGYYNLSRDFFGLSHHVPMTASYLDPKDRSPHHAILQLPKLLTGTHPKMAPHYDEMVKQSAREGKLHKLAIMDYVLGHKDRNMNNMAFDSQAHPYLTNNEKSFGTPNIPEYWHTVDAPHKIVNHSTKEWLDTLDPETLMRSVKQNGLPLKYARLAADRLAHAKHSLRNSDSIMNMYHQEKT